MFLDFCGLRGAIRFPMSRAEKTLPDGRLGVFT